MKSTCLFRRFCCLKEHRQNPLGASLQYFGLLFLRRLTVFSCNNYQNLARFTNKEILRIQRARVIPTTCSQVGVSPTQDLASLSPSTTRPSTRVVLEGSSIHLTGFVGTHVRRVIPEFADAWETFQNVRPNGGYYQQRSTHFYSIPHETEWHHSMHRAIHKSRNTSRFHSVKLLL
jgi:hypothetical protein